MKTKLPRNRLPRKKKECQRTKIQLKKEFIHTSPEHKLIFPIPEEQLCLRFFNRILLDYDPAVAATNIISEIPKEKFF